MQISKEQLIEMYRKLLLCRKVDDKLQEMNSTGVFSGWMCLGAGQEAILIAVSEVLRKGDYLKPSYCGAHSSVATGARLKSVFGSKIGRESPLIRACSLSMANARSGRS